jgi:predicted RecB family nuclease
MNNYRITISALVKASSQVEAEKLALKAVDDYRGTKEYINNDSIVSASLETVVIAYKDRQ